MNNVLMLFKSVATFCIIVHPVTLLVMKKFVSRDLMLWSITYFIVLAIGLTI